MRPADYRASESCNRILIIYAGCVVESESTSNILTRPKHPYNQAMQWSIPALRAKRETLHTIPGLPPDLSKPIHGCPFASRCEFVRKQCVTSTLALKEVAPSHSSVCLRVQLGDIELEPPNFVVAIS
jgi:oligopeptide transport system ATP-binding protein